MYTITELLYLSIPEYHELVSSELDTNDDNYYTTASCDYSECFHCGETIELEYFLVDGNPMCTECHAHHFNNEFEWELKILENIISTTTQEESHHVNHN